MTEKRIVPRKQAHDDVTGAVDHYAREGGPDLALDFVEALEAAYHAITEYPGIGSPRYAHELRSATSAACPLSVACLLCRTR